MKTFSIKELELLTGTKSHTLRVWEKRYGAFKPVRTKGNNRLYSSDDLQKALSFSLLCLNKKRISKIVALTPKEINAALDEINHPQLLQLKTVYDLILCMYRLDTENFEKSFILAFKKWPAEQVMADIIYPFLKRTGLLWKGKRLTEEHFAVTAIRSKIIFCIENLPAAYVGKKILLFLPGKGQLDLLLLYSHYIFRKNGWHVLYMGNDISDINIKTAIACKMPDFIFTHLPKGVDMNAEAISFFMNENSAACRFIIALNPNEEVQIKNLPNLISLPFEKAVSVISDFSK